MNIPSSYTHLAAGLAIAATAALVLFAMVRFELAPRVGVNGRGVWMLAAGLGGLGVLGFAVKLAAIGLILQLPETVIRPAAAQTTLREVRFPDLERIVPPPLPRPRYVWQALPEYPPAPADNPQSAAKAALGERLFFDKRLSRDGTLACVSCHDVTGKAGTDGRRVSSGIGGQLGGRNAPTVWNAAFQSVLFWDGRAASLEEQATGPLVNPVEMGMSSLAEVERRVAADPEYRAAFRQVFGQGDGVSIGRIAAALAAYERTLVTPDTPYDRFVRGDRSALDAAQVRGMALFESVGCVTCHGGPNFSGASVFDGHAPFRLFPTRVTPYATRFRLTDDAGRAPQGSAAGVWRVPSLRNVALTAPYFHNGAVASLEDAVRIMASSQLGRPLPDEPGAAALQWSAVEHTLSRLERRPLTDGEVKDIVAFLHALSDDRLATARRP